MLRRHYGFRIGPGELHDAARALDVVDLANESPSATPFGPFSPAPWTTSRYSMRRSRGSSFQDRGVPQHESALDASRTGTPAPAAANRSPRAYAPAIRADADDMSSRHGGPMTPSSRLAISSTSRRSSRPPAIARSMPMRALRPSCRGSNESWRETARSFVRRLHIGLSRRWRPASRGQRFDFRRTLRAGLQTGGESLSPRWRRRPGGRRESSARSTAAAR